MGEEDSLCLHELFSRQAQLTPDTVAIVSEGVSPLTFRQVDELTDVLAVNLRHRGVLRDTWVGIYVEKSNHFALSYIAILKAGGAYLPIETSYPSSLLKDVLFDSNPIAVITNEQFKKDLFTADSAIGDKLIILDGDWEVRLRGENFSKGEHSPLTLKPDVDIDSLAYLVYTSGTTGKPKGIMCPHRGAVISYKWRNEHFPFQPDERVACNIFFVWEMLRSLLVGIPLYIIPDDIIYDPPRLVDYLYKNKITRVLLTPSLLETVLEAADSNIQKNFKFLRIIWLCGEVVTTNLRDSFVLRFPWIRLLNLYSISECHDVAATDLTEHYQAQGKDDKEKRQFCPAGSLLPKVTVVILNEKLKPQPVGAPGEIYVGGPTLAQGYLNRPKMNSLRFISTPDSVPKSVGDRLYRTGDWGYLLSADKLEICGRCDSMVKIRGYSIELQAVESVLMDLTSVKSCAVIAEGAEGTDKFLVAYIVEETPTTRWEIRASLKTRLPFYMIPAHFVFLNNMPLLASSGKVNRKALPKFDTVMRDSGVERDIVPHTSTETSLAAIWKELLRMPILDIQESFFDLGGHSLLVTRMLTAVREQLKVDLTVKEMFKYPTLSQLAKLIDIKLSGDSTEIIEEIPKETPAKLDLLSEVNFHDQGWINLDMALRAFWRHSQLRNKWFKANVLLTGATGFIGAFLLKELLLNTETHVYCLVRELPEVTALERLIQTMTNYEIILNPNSKTSEKISDDKIKLQDAFKNRVTALKGNVALVNLGIEMEIYMGLSYEIDYIIHAAAVVNLIYPYEALHGPNVIGTQNIIVFARTTKIKPLHHISTNAVFVDGHRDCKEDSNMLNHYEDLMGGYGQSKWVAEQLVLRASSRGLPTVIYRLGNVSGHSVTASWNKQDFNLFTIQAITNMKSAPLIDWKIEMTPVDFIADFIVTCSQNLMSSLNKVYHLVQRETIDLRWMVEWMRNHGWIVESTSYSGWLKRLEEEKHDLLLKLLTNIEMGRLDNLSIFDMKNTDLLLAERGKTYPLINNNLLENYFYHLAGRGVIISPQLKNPQFMPRRPLENRVAIVTGASSGIGHAVSLLLARRGAKVALAARRTEKLEKLKEIIESEAGSAVVVKTDVTDCKQVKDLVRIVDLALGPVDILINNAGVMYYTLMKNSHVDEWHTTIDVNCKGVVNTIGAALPGMIERKRGHIVNISSDAGRKGFPGLAVYSGSKFFVEGFSQALRHEVTESGVKVTCVQPGDVKTDLIQHTTDSEAREKYDGSESCKILDPTDIAEAIFYAVSQPDCVAVNEILIEPKDAPI